MNQLTLAFILGVICAVSVPGIDGDGEPECQTQVCKDTAKRILANMDKSIKACDNFYMHACGSFQKNEAIPDNEEEAYVLLQLESQIQQQQKEVLEVEMTPDDPLPYRNLKTLYKLCLDEKKIDVQGLGPAKAILEQVGGWPVLGNWKAEGWSPLDTEIKIKNIGGRSGAIFQVGVDVHPKDKTRRVIKVGSADLWLAHPYLLEGWDGERVNHYYQYMVDIAVLFGAKKEDAEQQLKEALNFQMELASITGHDDEFHEMGLQELTKQVRFIDWKTLLDETVGKVTTIKEDEIVVVSRLGFLKSLECPLKDAAKKRAIANTMMWQVVRDISASECLTTDVRQRYFKLIDRFGPSYESPRWSRCSYITAFRLPLAMSHFYVKMFFPQSSKKAAQEMVKQIKLEATENVNTLTWMDDETRQYARAKTENIAGLIGYPDEHEDINTVLQVYEGFTVDQDNYLEALMAWSRWNTEYSYRKLRTPVIKNEWIYERTFWIFGSYKAKRNRIRFPAGTLQMPLFDPEAPGYVNYAGIGHMMGHEVIKALSEKGSRYDADGNPHEWWSEKTKEEYEKKVSRLEEQYKNLKCSIPHVPFDPEKSSKDNVADNGGIKLAYHAYHRQLKAPEPKLPGLTDYTQDQLFWLSSASTWCTRYSSKVLNDIINDEPTAPPEIRINGILQNMPEFSKAFDCAEGTFMNPTEKNGVF